MEIEVSELQQELLKIMKAFHISCINNDLKYYMLGGTCLGAIRHKGFIPWDDDMDVGMPREDYDIFCRNAKDILPDDYELRYYKTTPNSPFHFAKLINKNTTLIEPKYHDYLEGIYIDLFPLDIMTDKNIGNRIRCQRIWFEHACVMNHCSTEKKKGVLKNFFMSYAKFRKLNKMHDCLERLMIKESKDTPLYLCNFLGAWKDREIIPIKIFGEGRLYEFEDTKLYGPEDSDSYLHSLYGDYMKLPPKEKQVCRHNYYYVNLHCPYKEYKQENL